MLRNKIDSIPNELILNAMKFCNPNTIVALCQVSRKMNQLASDKSIWLALCENHPVLRLLIASVIKNEDLKKSEIDFKKLYFSFFSNDPDAVKALFLPDATISVLFGSYEQINKGIPRGLFFPLPEKIERAFYLSEALGKKLIPNIESVKGFVKVDLPLAEVDLKELKVGKIIYNAAIKTKTAAEIDVGWVSASARNPTL